MLLVALGLVSVLAQSAVQVAPTTVITGRIVDAATRDGIADARVILLPVSSTGRGMSGPFDGRPPQALTDRDGRYTFENLAPGRYRINVQKTGFAPLDNRGLEQMDIVAGQRREAADMVLQRGGAIAGTVLDERAQPLTGARVMALRRFPLNPNIRGNNAASPPPALVAQAEVNDLGEFRLFGLAPGEYIIAATTTTGVMAERTMPRETTLVPTYFPDTPDAAAAQTLALSSGQTHAGITIRMIAVPAFQVSGIVRNEAGTPVANALVQLQSTEQSTRVVGMMTNRNRIHTDASGRFAITNVTTGSYMLSAQAPIVTGRPDNRAAGVPGAASEMTFVSGIIGGSVSGGMTTETRNGVTTQW
jgi:protocatechuate 3,4-dioxygenase beta subunit